MTWLPSPAIFEVAPLVPVASVWGEPWPSPSEQPKPAFHNDEDKKKLFGIEWAKDQIPFNAACKVFLDTTDALWASRNWLTDPIVIGAKDAYRQTVEASIALIDKSQFQVQLLKIATEKNPVNDKFYLAETKDRLRALELYAKVNQWIDNKSLIDASTTLVNNEMRITFVEPEIKEQPKLIQHSEPEINLNNEELPFKVVECA